ncbi:MAG: peptidoglycan-binding protein [Planctomycetes bacterium]|nr:peptidoglycan-binding protein [Planctomycetota bacterium]
MSDTVESAELQHVAVDGDVDLRTVVTGAEDGAACTFEVHKVEDGSVVATVQGEVLQGVAVGSWDPQLAPDGEDRGLRVYYTVTVDDQTTRSQELEVYLDWVEISSVDEEDQPLPDVPYKLKVGELEREGTTGSAATFREAGLPPGELDFEWRGPYQLVEWVDDKGPTRKAKLKKVHRLKFLWPDPERSGGRRLWFDDGTELELQDRFHAHTQRVNLPVDPDAPEQGSRVRLRVVGAEREHVKAGDKAFVKVEWPPEDQRSKRNDPARELVGGDAKPWAQGENEKGLELTFDADGGEASFELELGKAGGDQVTVHVGCTDRCDDAKLVITNRRRVWYQTTRMAHQALVDLHTGEATARAWLDAVAVELEAEEDVVWSDAPALDGPAGERGLAKVPAAWFEADATGEAAVVGSHNWEWFKKKFLRRHGPLGVHLVVADRIIWGTQWDGRTPFAQAFSVEWAPEVDPDTRQPTLSKFVFLPNRERFEVFPQALHDGGLTLREVTWSTPNRRSVPARFRGKSGAVDPAWVRIDRHGGRVLDQAQGRTLHEGAKGVWLELPEDSEPAQILAAGVTLRVRGRFHPGQTGRAGSTQAFQIVTTAVPDPGLANFIIAHELGHNMRQSAVRDTGATAAENRRFYLPPGFAFADHPHGYRGKGHQGPHCNFGLNDAGATHVRNVKPDGAEEFLPISGAAADQDSYPALRKLVDGEYVRVGGLCLMYGGARPNIAEETVGFCEHCAPFARASAIDDMHLDWGVAALVDDEEGAEVEAEEEEDPPETLRIRLLDEVYGPFANGSYELTLPDGSTVTGTTDADGLLEHPMPQGGGGGTCRIKYTPEGSDELDLTLQLPGGTADDDEACLAHLRNTGYAAPGEPLASAVSRFQAALGLAPTGQLDEGTRDAIDALFYGDEADALKRRLFEEA